METWKLQLVVVTFCTLLQTCGGLSVSAEEEQGLSADWQDDLQPETETDLSQLVDALMKRSKALRFYGLMGKRSAGEKKPFKVNRRNKGEMFVGLMGRSISSAESLHTRNAPATTTGIRVPEKTHGQGSSDKWIQILY